ncbi:MAG: DUF45 domain-containing protein [Clostridia bacterium]|nr:DUF45 domain-containing protein [Clostridia bacterium]
MKTVIVYSRRKTVGLRIKDGTLTVRAPIGTPRDYIDSLISKHKKWIDRAKERDAHRSAMTNSLSDEEILSLKGKALRYVTPLCERYARLLGLSYKKISVNSARSRLGSCSSLGNIHFSYRIMLYPERAREYVCLHEVCHLAEMNHSKRFYALIGRIMPDFRERRRLLREIK